MKYLKILIRDSKRNRTEVCNYCGTHITPKRANKYGGFCSANCCKHMSQEAKIPSMSMLLNKYKGYVE